MPSSTGLDSLRWLDRGTVEVFVAAGLALLTLLSALQAGGVRPATLWELTLCVGAALCSRRLGMGSLIAAVALVACIRLPSEQIGPGFHGCLIPLFSATRQARPIQAGAIAASNLLAIAYKTSNDVETPQSLFSYLVAWTFLFVLAGLGGHAIATIRRRTLDDNAEALALQRQELARHLHDTVAHDLSDIVMTSQRAQLDGHVSPESLASIIHTAQQSIAQLRAFMDALHVREEPLSLGPAESFESVIESSATHLEGQGFLVTRSAEGKIDALPSQVDTALALITREALHNIHRHADPAMPVIVMTETTASTVTLLVVNHPHPDRSPSRHGHYGLDGIQRHVQAIGGTAQVGLLGVKWTLRVTCPLSPSPEHMEGRR